MKLNGLLVLLASTLCLGGSLANSNTKNIDITKNIKTKNEDNDVQVKAFITNDEISFETTYDANKYEIVDIDLINAFNNVVVDTISKDETSFKNYIKGATYQVKVNYKLKFNKRSEILSSLSNEIKFALEEDSFHYFQATEITPFSAKIVQTSVSHMAAVNCSEGLLFKEDETNSIHYQLVNSNEIRDLIPDTNYTFKAKVNVGSNTYEQNIHFKTQKIDTSRKHLYLKNKDRYNYYFYVNEMFDYPGGWEYHYTLYKNENELVKTFEPQYSDHFAILNFNFDLETSYTLKVIGYQKFSGQTYATFEDQVTFETPNIKECFSNLYELDIYFTNLGFRAEPNTLYTNTYPINYGNYKVYHNGELIYDEIDFSHPIDAVVGEEYTVTQDYKYNYNGTYFTYTVSKTFIFKVANEVFNVEFYWNPDASLVNVKMTDIAGAESRFKSVKIYDKNGNYIDESISLSFVTTKLQYNVFYNFEVIYEKYGKNGEIIEVKTNFHSRNSNEYRLTAEVIGIYPNRAIIALNFDNLLEEDEIDYIDYKIDSVKAYDEYENEIPVNCQQNYFYEVENLKENTSYKYVATYSYKSLLTNERVANTETFNFKTPSKARIDVTCTPIEGGVSYKVNNLITPEYHIEINNVSIVNSQTNELIVAVVPEESGTITGLKRNEEYTFLIDYTLVYPRYSGYVTREFVTITTL